VNAHAGKVDPTAISLEEWTRLDFLLVEVGFLCGIGLSPIPVYPNGVKDRKGKLRDKSPFDKGFQLRAFSDFEKTRAWFEEAIEYIGRCPRIGLLNSAAIAARGDRPVGRLIIIDKDVKGPDGKPVTTAAARHVDLESAIRVKLPVTVEDSSPSGGGHEFYWVSEAAFAVCSTCESTSVSCRASIIRFTP
jgi:hypothetical protein